MRNQRTYSQYVLFTILGGAIGLILVGAVVAALLAFGTVRLNDPSDSEIRTIMQTSPGNDSAVNILVLGKESCNLISGDQARGVTARLLIRFSDIPVWSKTPVEDYDNIALQNGQWVLVGGMQHLPYCIK